MRRRAAVDRDEARARERLKVELRDGVFVKVDAATDVETDAHVIGLELDLANGAGFHARDAHLRARAEPLDVGKVRPHPVAAGKQSAPDGRLHEADEQEDAAEKEEADALFFAEHPRIPSTPPAPRAGSSSYVGGRSERSRRPFGSRRSRLASGPPRGRRSRGRAAGCA